jgi:hypothetical protein
MLEVVSNFVIFATPNVYYTLVFGIKNMIFVTKLG